MKKSFLEETWLNIPYSRVPSPGVVSEPRAVWALLRLCVCALFGRAVHTSAADRGCPLEQMYPIVVHISLVTVLPAPLCVHPACFLWPGLMPGIAADPTAGDQAGWGSIVPWATSGIAGLSWRLLLCSLCCFRHYLWLTWGDNTAVVQGEAVNTVKYPNCPLGLRGEGLAQSFFSTSLFYFSTSIHLLQQCLSVSFGINLENISVVEFWGL